MFIKIPLLRKQNSIGPARCQSFIRERGKEFTQKDKKLTQKTLKLTQKIVASVEMLRYNKTFVC
jgi:hypothetical protein